MAAGRRRIGRGCAAPDPRIRRLAGVRGLLPTPRPRWTRPAMAVRTPTWAVRQVRRGAGPGAAGSRPGRHGRRAPTRRRPGVAFWTAAGDPAVPGPVSRAAAGGTGLGTEHPETLTTRANLARFTGMPRSERGPDQFALLPSATVLGPRPRTRSPPATWPTHREAGVRPRHAIGRAAAGVERVLGNEHPFTLTARSNCPLDRGGIRCARRTPRATGPRVLAPRPQHPSADLPTGREGWGSGQCPGPDAALAVRGQVGACGHDHSALLAH
jgi:hypothetical protein